MVDLVVSAGRFAGGAGTRRPWLLAGAAAALGKRNGSVPQMVLGGDKGGPATFLPLPIAAAK